jgi:hypothetical protein
MITPLDINLKVETVKELLDYFNSTADFYNELDRSKFTINEPSGDFFYDPWVIKPEFKGSIYEKIIDSLQTNVGEARLIVMKPGSCYHSHADIDDRYHLNIQGQYSYLINLDNQNMYPTTPDGIWYTMDASPRHTAANFGSIDRIQLVVRQLLKRNTLKNPVTVNVFPESSVSKPRFTFDDCVSPWLNRSVKKGILTNFKTDLTQIWFDLEKENINELDQIFSKNFIVKIYNQSEL